MDLRLTEENLKWLLLSFVFSSLSIFFSYLIFPSQVSILSISFLTIALTPPLYSMMSKEEQVVAHSRKKIGFIKTYSGLIMVLIMISIGIFLAFSFWYGALPSDSAYNGGTCSTTLPCREAVFDLQMEYVGQPRDMDTLLGLMLICFVLSLFMGAGALLIIAWDISSLVVGTSTEANFLLYLPQLLALFLTGLAGTLLSFAIVHHEWRSKSFFVVVKDSLVLLLFSLVFVAISHLLI
jgi:hypothetical protein